MPTRYQPPASADRVPVIPLVLASATPAVSVTSRPAGVRADREGSRARDGIAQDLGYADAAALDAEQKALEEATAAENARKAASEAERAEDVNVGPHFAAMVARWKAALETFAVQNEITRAQREKYGSHVWDDLAAGRRNFSGDDAATRELGRFPVQERGQILVGLLPFIDADRNARRNAETAVLQARALLAGRFRQFERERLGETAGRAFDVDGYFARHRAEWEPPVRAVAGTQTAPESRPGSLSLVTIVLLLLGVF